MLNLIVLSILLCHFTQAKPAFAGGLSGPVVPAGAMHPPPPSQATAAPGDPDCPPTDGALPLYVPDETSCTKYTVCSGGFGMKLDCPPGLHFNRKLSYCDFPPNAKCPLLEGVTQTISFTDLKGPPGIDATAYPNVGLTGLPKFGNPDPGIGQLSDTEFVADQASKSGPSTYRPNVEQIPTEAGEAPQTDAEFATDQDSKTESSTSSPNEEQIATDAGEATKMASQTNAEVVADQDSKTGSSTYSPNEEQNATDAGEATRIPATAEAIVGIDGDESTAINNETTVQQVTTIQSRISKLRRSKFTVITI